MTGFICSRMLMHMLATLFFFAATINLVRAESPPKVISLATTDWCPYLCTNQSEKPGIVVEYYRFLEEQLGVKFEFYFYPWSRALKAVNMEKHHGLATAVPSEAPDMSMSNQAIMTYQVCIHTLPDSSWIFTGADSLGDLRLGVMADYGYGEPIDSHISTAAKERVLALSGNNGINRLINLAQKQRIDGFVADRQVMRWFLRDRTLASDAVRNAGCLPETPFYLALDPSLAWGAHFLESLNEVVAKEENIKHLVEKIFPEYR